jgi:N-acetylmuramoyl-L-alanine amidase
MRPEAFEVADRDHGSSVEGLALTLLALGSDQSVRVLEALAAALVNRAHQPGDDHDLGLHEPPAAGFCQPRLSAPGDELQLCRRIARRALRGSLADPTVGASAFHRLEDNPTWARDLLPVASFGSFLFYQLPTRHGA